MRLDRCWWAGCSDGQGHKGSHYCDKHYRYIPPLGWKVPGGSGAVFEPSLVIRVTRGTVERRE